MEGMLECIKCGKKRIQNNEEAYDENKRLKCQYCGFEYAPILKNQKNVSFAFPLTELEQLIIGADFLTIKALEQAVNAENAENGRARVEITDEELEEAFEKSKQQIVTEKKASASTVHEPKLQTKHKVVSERIDNHAVREPESNLTRTVDEALSRTYTVPQTPRGYEGEAIENAKSELRHKSDFWISIVMFISLIVFALAIFLGVTILAELDYTETGNKYVSMVLQYLSLDNIYTLIYIFGSLSLICTAYYFSKVRSGNFMGYLGLTLLFSGGAYLLIFILLNNPLEIILNFIGNILLLIIGESQDVFKEGTGITTFVIITGINYIISLVLKMVLFSQQRQMRRNLRQLRNQAR